MFIKALVPLYDVVEALMCITADFDNDYVGDQEKCDIFIRRCYANSRAIEGDDIPVSVIESVSRFMLTEGEENDLLDFLRKCHNPLDKK